MTKVARADYPTTFYTMEERTYTLGELLNAIEKNGLPQTRGIFWHYTDDGAVNMACAAGQGALNLGLRNAGFAKLLRHWHYAGLGLSLADAIFNMNDQEKLTIQEIVDRCREKFAGRLEETSKEFVETVNVTWEEV